MGCKSSWRRIQGWSQRRGNEKIQLRGKEGEKDKKGKDWLKYDLLSGFASPLDDLKIRPWGKHRIFNTKIL